MQIKKQSIHSSCLIQFGKIFNERMKPFDTPSILTVKEIKYEKLILKAMKQLNIPQEVHVYHSLYPLESFENQPLSKMFGYSTFVYKAISSIDGLPYVLRRIEGMII